MTVYEVYLLALGPILAVAVSIVIYVMTRPRPAPDHSADPKS